MCLRDQGIDDDDGGISRVRRERGVSNNNRGVGRRQGIDDTSKGSETMTETTRVRGQLLRLRRRDDGPE